MAEKASLQYAEFRVDFGELLFDVFGDLVVEVDAVAVHRHREGPEVLHPETIEGFGMQLFLRPACARCRYTSTSRPADFTLADYWGLDEKLALPVERDKGVSMVLVNSARGQAVFDALSPRFGQVERPLAEAVAGNPRLASPLKANPRRAAFFAAFAALPFAEVEKRFLALPSLPYRAAAKVLTPAMKEKIRKLLK